MENEILERFYQWEKERLSNLDEKPLKKWEMDLIKKVVKIRMNRINKILKNL